jgi:hypothetical protein
MGGNVASVPPFGGPWFRPITLFAWILGHIILAYFGRSTPTVGTAHAVATFVAGSYLAWQKRRPALAFYAIAYVSSVEVVWRMTRAEVFYEFGKYVTVFLCLLAIYRSGNFRRATIPGIFLLMLLPSSFPPLLSNTWSDYRNDLSFNLSGPFSLAICVWYFSRLKISESAFARAVAIAMGPVAACATLALLGIISAKELVFSRGSSMLASGGFGPGQVSAVLSLGALLGILAVVGRIVKGGARPLLIVVAGWAAIQSILTFSRAGLYMLLGGLSVAFLYMARTRRFRSTIFVISIAVFLLSNLVVMPYLDSLTGGMFSVRYGDTGRSGRDEILEGDLQVWYENPILGVGPGKAEGLRSYGPAVAHTEYTRLLAEHGIFGLGSILVLLLLGLRSLRGQTSPLAKGVAGALCAWSLMYLATNGMRLVAPSFTFGLAVANLLLAAMQSDTQTGEQRTSTIDSVVRPHDRIHEPAPMNYKP